MQAFFENEIIWAILFGFALRFLFIIVFQITLGKPFNIKLPALPSFLGVAAIAYYFHFSEEYADMEFINGFVITGLFLPELFRATSSLITTSTKRRKT